MILVAGALRWLKLAFRAKPRQGDVPKTALAWGMHGGLELEVIFPGRSLLRRAMKCTREDTMVTCNEIGREKLENEHKVSILERTLWERPSCQ